MKSEGRSIRQEILRSFVDEIRGKVHQTTNLKKYCKDLLSGGPSL
jgi:hypothetical protein